MSTAALIQTQILICISATYLNVPLSFSNDTDSLICVRGCEVTQRMCQVAENIVVSLLHCSQTSLIWSGGGRGESPLALTAERCGEGGGAYTRGRLPSGGIRGNERGRGRLFVCTRCHHALFIWRTAVFPRLSKSPAEFRDSRPASFPPSHPTHHQHTAQTSQLICAVCRQMFSSCL